jgi:NADH-quinone oxidoreductase subunit I
MLGTGILKGLAVTAKNFVGSYRTRERMVTVQYPEERLPIPEAYRSFPFLVFDGEQPIDGLRCVACKICENECPPKCIYIVQDRDEKGRPVKRPKVFDIDISVCMSCQICAEVCPFDAIKMDQQFEIASPERFHGLLVHREQLAKPNAYFHQIRPTEAVETDARQAAEKQAKAAAAAAKAATPKAAVKPASKSPAATAEAPRAEAPKPPPPAA